MADDMREAIKDIQENSRKTYREVGEIKQQLKGFEQSVERHEQDIGNVRKELGKVDDKVDNNRKKLYAATVVGGLAVTLLPLALANM